MRGLLCLPLILLAMAVVLSASPAGAEVVNNINLTIAAATSQQNRIRVDVDITSKLVDKSAYDTSDVTGNMETKLVGEFDPSSQNADNLAAITFTGGAFNFVDNISMNLDYSFLIGEIDISANNVGGYFNTINPPGSGALSFVSEVSNTVTYEFPVAPNHQVIVNQGTIVADGSGLFLSGLYYSQNLSTDPIYGTTTDNGTIEITTTSVVGTTAYYDMRLELPINIVEVLDLDTSLAEGTVTLSGKYVAEGSFTRTFTPTPTLALVDEGLTATGLRRYTLTATGTGIASLGKFTIDGNVNQVFPGGNPSEWTGDGSASGAEDDSHVIFGDMRFADLPGTWDPSYGDPPDQVTEETIKVGGNSGLGTLNNFDESVTAINDLYTKYNAASNDMDTVELMQLVVKDGYGFDVTLDLLCSTEYDPVTYESLTSVFNDLTISLPTTAYDPGDANRDGIVDADDAKILALHWQMAGDADWEDGDFNDDNKVDDIDATIMAVNWTVPVFVAVPEPGTALLLTGMLMLVGLIRRRR